MRVFLLICKPNIRGTGTVAKQISVKILQAVKCPVSYRRLKNSALQRKDNLTCVHKREAFVDFHRKADWLEVFVPEAGYRLADSGPFTPRDQRVETNEG